ncbi:MAG: hypothetical protein WAO19_14195 [Candidatus Kryptoniota bacterium]
MEKREKIERLKGLLKPAIENRGAFLVDISLKGDAKRELIEVYCETEKGITIGECAEISREILPLVDSSKVIGDNFRLEVSSPGVGVPLKDKRQYKRNIGKLMSVKYHDGFEVRQIEGDLIGLTDEEMIISGGTGPVEIGYASIVEAVVQIRW